MKRIRGEVIAAILGLTSTAASAQTAVPPIVSAANPAEADIEQQLRVISGDPQAAKDVVHRAVQNRAEASELRRTLDDAVAALSVLRKTLRPRH